LRKHCDRCCQSTISDAAVTPNAASGKLTHAPGTAQRIVTLFMVINPLGTLPVFLAMTGALDSATRRATTSAAPRNDIEQRT
jgi:MarC family integral membrane protein